MPDIAAVRKEFGESKANRLGLAQIRESDEDLEKMKQKRMEERKLREEQ